MYVFSLNFNTFNIEGMCIWGDLAACGLILMVYLNLPPHLCYKLEYMYIAGIIPGHEQPTEMDLNHYFRPLVNDMEQSWKLGIRYTMTASFPEGCITWSAIAIAVMDLPAAQHSSQLIFIAPFVSVIRDQLLVELIIIIGSYEMMNKFVNMQKNGGMRWPWRIVNSFLRNMALITLSCGNFHTGNRLAN